MNNGVFKKDFQNIKNKNVKVINIEDELSSEEEENDEKYHNINLQDFLETEENLKE